jgi:hypothetical protein
LKLFFCKGITFLKTNKQIRKSVASNLKKTYMFMENDALLEEVNKIASTSKEKMKDFFN